MSASMDSPSAVMLSQVTEFTETEKRFRRIRYALIAIFFGLTLSLIVYLVLSWETSEAEDDDILTEKDLSSFQIIMIISICAVVVGSVASFLILEYVRRRTIRDLAHHHNEVLNRYYEDGGGSISEPRTGYTSRCSTSTRSSWAVRPPPSASSCSPSSPPPAYEELVQRGEFVFPSTPNS